MAKETKSLIIFLAGKIQNIDHIHRLIKSKKFDFFAADGGYILAEQLGVQPKCILGDFDSSRRPMGDNVLAFSAEKDETDSELALNLAIKEEYTEIWMIAPFGGRMDHSFANLTLLDRCGQAGIKLYLYDGVNLVYLLEKGSYSFSDRFRYVSFFAHRYEAELSLKGFKYELDRFHIKPEMTIGISNEPISKKSIATIYQGQVLCMCIEKEILEEL